MAEKDVKKISFAIPKESYKHILIGFGAVVIGFLLMMGGGSDNTAEFSREIFLIQTHNPGSNCGAGRIYIHYVGYYAQAKRRKSRIIN